MTEPIRDLQAGGAHRVRGESTSVHRAREVVRGNLRRAAAGLMTQGLPEPALDGKLLRPLAAYLTVPPEERRALDHRFWNGALAVEMVHEASLLHDDILDDAPTRRGRPTMSAERGVGPALVLGDHLLTSSYRAAAAAECPEFLHAFIRSVERTVAGEITQERSQGRALTRAEYTRTITGKSGELFRSALTLAPTLLELGDPGRAGALGARLGCLYQMVDDFLDYCPNARRGKEPLQDYRQRKWTWPLDLIGVDHFEAQEEEILDRLFRDHEGHGMAPMLAGVRRMDREIRDLTTELEAEGLETDQLAELLRDWTRILEEAALREISLREEPLASRGALSLAARSPSGVTPRGVRKEIRRELRRVAGALDRPADRLAYFGRHATSFRFASHLFPREELERVAGVYAFCRFTDDLVDESVGEDPALLGARLEEWLAMARGAYEGSGGTCPLLVDVMGDMRRSGVPFHYVQDLIDGVRMDLEPPTYRTLEDLRIYSYRVASVVGGWLTELFGIRDPWVLERAYALGHAMQLTNILRDVGEDMRAGRVYLPSDLMRDHGVDRGLLDSMEEGRRPPSSQYRSLLENLMEEADAEYARAFQAIPALPRFFQGPVAVAAGVYQGIHREIRRNGYDNLNRRAHTSLPRKLVLGTKALVRLRRLRVAFEDLEKKAESGPARPGPADEGQEAVA